MVDELKRSLLLELDYRLEAQNMIAIGATSRSSAHRRAAAGPGLLNGACAHDGLHQRAEDHGRQPAGTR
jgi:hypothetical protein